MVNDEIVNFSKKHEEMLLHHFNVEAIQPLDKCESVLRLKRKIFELV
jgi:hypothetical protein